MYFTEQTTQQNCLRFSKGHCNFTSAIHGLLLLHCLQSQTCGLHY